MDRKKQFDFWYAVNNTEIVVMPRKHLETFGATILNYHMVAELMDATHQVRVRVGKIHAFKPQIITPEAYSKTFLEGFGDEAHKYIDWLKQNEKQHHILQYGYTLKNEAFSEHIISDNLTTVVERVKKDVAEKNDTFSAVLTGVDDLWDVSLIKLFLEVVTMSAPANVNELARYKYQEIEKAFQAARKDPTKIQQLGIILQKHKLFSEYEERFFALIKSLEK